MIAIQFDPYPFIFVAVHQQMNKRNISEMNTKWNENEIENKLTRKDPINLKYCYFAVIISLCCILHFDAGYGKERCLNINVICITAHRAAESHSAKHWKVGSVPTQQVFSTNRFPITRKKHLVRVSYNRTEPLQWVSKYIFNCPSVSLLCSRD